MIVQNYSKFVQNSETHHEDKRSLFHSGLREKAQINEQVFISLSYLAGAEDNPTKRGS